MSDIRKNLTLSAQLDDSQLRKQLDILKKEMGKAFNVDAGSLNDLKSSIKDIAKEFGVQLRKELEGIRGARSKGAQMAAKSDLNISEIGSIQVKEMTVTNMIVNAMTVKGSAGGSGGTGGGAGVPRARGDEGGGGGSEGPSDFLAKNKTLIKMAAAGLGTQQMVSSIINIQQTMAERSNRLSRDFDAGLGVEGIARQAGRNRMGMAMTAGIGGGIAGGAVGAKIGGGIGSFFGPAGTAIGGALGGIAGGIGGGMSAYMGTSNAVGELSKEQVQLLSDAEGRARQLSPLRQQLMAGGGISGDVMTDQMRVGARQFGMSGEDTLQSMMQARESLGNRGAAGAFNQIMSNQRFLGIGAGTSAQAIETFAGASGEGRAASTTKQAEIIKRGVAAGLDVSKSGRFLQTTMQYLQNTTGLGRVDTDAATNRIAGLAAGFGGGEVTDMSLQQSMTLAQQLRKESGSMQGLSGAGNMLGVAGIGSQFGGFDTGTMLALSKMEANATDDDIMGILSQNQGGAQKGDLAAQVKAVRDFKNSDIMGNFVDQLAPGNMGSFLMAEETGGSTQDVLGRRRAMAGRLTPEALAGAGEALEGAKAGVTGSSEFQLDVAQFTRSTESAARGLETFTTITGQMVTQMKTLLDDLTAAQKRFDGMARQSGYTSIKN